MVGENVTEPQVKESVMETIFDIFYKLMEMSDHFERFPLNETYIDLQYQDAVSTDFSGFGPRYRMFQLGRG